ncbi:MAG: hypothetical protein ACXW3X_03170, partial [Rhodoplanes sp.]
TFWNRVESTPCAASSTKRTGQPWVKPGNDEVKGSQRIAGDRTPDNFFSLVTAGQRPAVHAGDQRVMSS